MRSSRILLGGSLAALAALGGSAGGVMAAHGFGGPGAGLAGGGAIAYGTLAGLTATSATITTPGNTSNTVSVTLNANATYTARSQTAAVAGLKTGDQVAVRGRSVNGVISASALEYDVTPFPATVSRYLGTVSTASATSLTITTSGGTTVTAPITSSTVFAGSLATGGATALASNEEVRVTVAQYTDGTTAVQSVAPVTARARTTVTSTPTATATATP